MKVPQSRNEVAFVSIDHLTGGWRELSAGLNALDTRVSDHNGLLISHTLSVDQRYVVDGNRAVAFTRVDIRLAGGHECDRHADQKAD